VRRDAIAYTRRRKAQGGSRVTIARELGVSAMTVGRWVAMAMKATPARKVRRKPKPAPELRRVHVAEVPPASRGSRGAVVVTTAHGLRVDGLALEEVIAILRALG
jgi:hypothetical protein